MLTTAPVLAYPKYKQEFLLETDASESGLGAVWAYQKQEGTVRPISYVSRTLQSHEKNCGITELEGFGVVWAVHRCIIYTDHKTLNSVEYGTAVW